MKKIINVLIIVFSILGKSGNNFLLKSFRNTNGRLGILLRYIFIKNIALKIGDNVSVFPGVFLLNLEHVIIGDNVSIHPFCYIDGAGGIDIGNNVSIAHNTSILTTNHSWNDKLTPIKYNVETFENVSISDDVWIACGVRILAGVKIQSRSVIAAGAVVNNDVFANSLVGGIPARFIKSI